MSEIGEIDDVVKTDVPGEVSEIESPEAKSEIDDEIDSKYDKYLEDDNAQEFEFKSMEEKETEREADLRNCPIEGSGGSWEGDRGESKWVPEREETPKVYNPDGKTWGEILDENNIDGVDFKEGEPEFGEIIEETVEIDDFTDDRDDNFDQADEILAERWDCDPKDVEAWRKENRYSWHERRDCETLELVPSEVHGNISHSGGVSKYKEEHGK